MLPSDNHSLYGTLVIRQSVLTIITIITVILATSGGLWLLWILISKYFPWLPEDIAYLKAFIPGLIQLKRLRKKGFTICDKFTERSKETPDKKFILFEDQTWSYKEMHRWANKCARCIRSLGIRQKDKIGLFMMNEPTFIAIWFGCIRAGGITAFLNFNLRSKALLHCIDIAEIKLLIVGKDKKLIEAIKQIESELEDRNITVLVYGNDAFPYKSMATLVDSQSDQDVPHDWREGLTFDDAICYIYTSGTTGLPKAVEVSNYKAWMGGVFFTFCRAHSNDVVYAPLPLYHTSSALLCFCGVLNSGCAIAFRRKFSARHFWEDCRKHEATIIQYIGETIRYICNQPATSDDRNHFARLAIGNGLRPDTWRIFLDRFGPHIKMMEVYASTEGNIGFINFHNHFGSIGSLSPLFKLLTGAQLLKYDPDMEDIIRGSDGKPVLAKCNEPGLLIGKITPRFRISTYKGNKNLTDKKIFRDLFKKGDQYFNTGDMLICNDQYLLSFCDRTGDTFRWKGENVSTNEVSDAILMMPSIKEANTYGVTVEGQEGKAGMVAIVMKDDKKLDVTALYAHVCAHLPSYAQPLFVRVVPELEITGTFKQRKVALRKEGYDLDKIKNEPVYYLHKAEKSYVPLTKDLSAMLNEMPVK